VDDCTANIGLQVVAPTAAFFKKAIFYGILKGFWDK
jgi:hypothetical protein